jgi:hypothetical protein
MATMPPAELLTLWKLEKLPLEMAMGHVLQNLVKIHADIEAINTTLYKLKSDTDRLAAHAGIELPPKTPRRSRKN